jgi:hypothetical protein
MPGRGWSQAKRAMRPVRVVVLHVNTQDALELAPACDQEPVEAVAANRSDPAFRERVRIGRPKRRSYDLDALALEDIVEGAAELAVAVVDQEPDGVGCVNRMGCQNPVPPGNQPHSHGWSEFWHPTG